MKEFLTYTAIVLGLLIVIPALPFAVAALFILIGIVGLWFLLTADKVNINVNNDTNENE